MSAAGEVLHLHTSAKCPARFRNGVTFPRGLSCCPPRGRGRGCLSPPARALLLPLAAGMTQARLTARAGQKGSQQRPLLRPGNSPGRVLGSSPAARFPAGRAGPRARARRSASAWPQGARGRSLARGDCRLPGPHAPLFPLRKPGGWRGPGGGGSWEGRGLGRGGALGGGDWREDQVLARGAGSGAAGGAGLVRPAAAAQRPLAPARCECRSRRLSSRSRAAELSAVLFPSGGPSGGRLKALGPVGAHTVHCRNRVFPRRRPWARPWDRVGIGVPRAFWVQRVDA